MSYLSAERVQTNEGRQYHIGVGPGDVADLVLLVGDPNRAEKAGRCLDSIRMRHSHREYHTLTGSQRGREITIMCVGMGAGSMEIAVVELCQILKRPTFIRAGSSGALQPHIELGDLVVSQGAYRLESASLGYVEPGYPAFAHAEAVVALCRAADEQGVRYHTGVTGTAAGFYGAQARTVPGFTPRDPHLLDRLTEQGVANLEMEASCLLTLASLRGARAGCVCAIYASRPQNRFIEEAARDEAESHCIAVGLAGLHRLAEMADASRGKTHWHDALPG